MGKIRIVSWYFGVFLTIIFLVVSIFQQDFMLAICGFILAWQLKKSMNVIPLPKIYQKLHAASAFERQK